MTFVKKCGELLNKFLSILMEILYFFLRQFLEETLEELWGKICNYRYRYGFRYKEKYRYLLIPSSIDKYRYFSHHQNEHTRHFVGKSNSSYSVQYRIQRIALNTAYSVKYTISHQIHHTASCTPYCVKYTIQCQIQCIASNTAYSYKYSVQCIGFECRRQLQTIKLVRKVQAIGHVIITVIIL